MAKQQKGKYATVGSLIFQSQFDDEGNRLEGEYKTDEKGRKLYALKLDKNTEVIINGVNMTGKTLYVSRPDTKLARLLDKGVKFLWNAEVVEIDFKNNKVFYADTDARTIEYDELIFAVGKSGIDFAQSLSNKRICRSLSV